MSQLVSGVLFSDKKSPFEIQLWLFKYSIKMSEDPYWRPVGRSSTPYSGEGRFEHFKILAQACFPEVFEWNDWADEIGRLLCEGRHSAISGCAGSGKSTTAGLYVFFWWLCSPNDSAILIASTTIESAKKRIWKNIRTYYTELLRKFQKLWVAPDKKDGPTTIIGNPKPSIRASEKDVVHGIHVIAVAKGEVEKGVESLKGFHPARLMMVVDEADSVTEAVIEVMPNQEVGTEEYQTVWLGNDPSLFNPLGKMMQPEKGKPITLGHTNWTSHNGTRCIRLDAYDSPNIRDNNKWKGIVRQKDIDAVVARHGANSPQVWIMLRGIHPPEGADNTVVSEALLTSNKATEREVVWKRGSTTSGLLDPAFGGDRCIFRTMKRGHDTEGQMRVLLGPPIEIQISANDASNPAEYQIARRVKELCIANGIPPQEFITDSTGTGRGVAAVLQREWSPAINLCEFGGSPSTMPVSDENPKPANEEYANKVTELWFSFRVFVEAGMIRGLDSETAAEFCQRQFEIKGKKTVVESKRDMKDRGAPSPDLADAVVVGIHLLREKGINATVMTETKQAYTQDFDRKLKQYDIDSMDNSSPMEYASSYGDIF